MKWIRFHFDRQWSLHHKRSRRFASRLFGPRKIPRELWDFHHRSLRGGLCLGVFISLTPTIPFHMILSTIGAIYFRVNLPIALAACWITNPLTVYPIFRFAWRIGKTIHDAVPVFRDVALIDSDSGRWARFFSHTLSLWTGCLILAMTTTTLLWLLMTLIHTITDKLRRAKGDRSADEQSRSHPDPSVKTSDPAGDS